MTQDEFIELIKHQDVLLECRSTTDYNLLMPVVEHETEFRWYDNDEPPTYFAHRIKYTADIPTRTRMLKRNYLYFFHTVNDSPEYAIDYFIDYPNNLTLYANIIHSDDILLTGLKKR